jgi:uncharacterized protein (UPF0548 family)
MSWSIPDLFSLIAAFCFGVILPWAQRTERGQPPVIRGLALAGLPFLILASGWERGAVAAVFALPALVYAIWLFAHGGGRFLVSWDERAPTRWLNALGTTGPLVAATAWIWSRYDGTFAGFPDPLATLTTVHFAITFGALPAALVAWTRKETIAGLWNDLALWLYVLSAPATALCFALRSQPMIPGLAEVFCAVLFALSFFVWWLTLRSGRPRWLALPLLIGFALGAGYTLAQYSGWPYFSIPEMLISHGLLNLIGTALLIGFAPAQKYPAVAPAPDPTIPLNPGSEATSIFIDHHRRELGRWSEERFASVRKALLGYRFYPAATMVRRAQFEEENREARAGDRLGLGLFLPNLPGLNPVCLAAVVEINELADEAELVKLGYVTTRKHYGQGAWVAEVKREEDQMILEVRCHIRPSRWFVWLGLPLYRYFQLQAFQAGYTQLLRVVEAGPETLPDLIPSDS